MAGRLTNFEIYGDDPDALAEFYRSVFGWRVEKAAGVDYWRIAIDAVKRSAPDGLTLLVRAVVVGAAEVMVTHQPPPCIPPPQSRPMS